MYLLSFFIYINFGTECNNLFYGLNFAFVKLYTMFEFCSSREFGTVSDDPHIIKTLSSLGELHFWNIIISAQLSRRLIGELIG